MVGNHYEAMVSRVAHGVQSLGTGTGTGYATGASAGDDIAGLLAQVPSKGAGDVAARGLKGRTLALMGRMGAWGPVRALGAVGAALTAFDVGWQIGGLVSGLLFDERTAGQGYELYAQRTERMYSAGDALPTFGGEPNGATAPYAGGVVTYQNNIESVLRDPEAESDAECPNSEWGHSGEPADATFIQTETRDVVCGGEDFYLAGGVYFDPLAVTSLPGEGGEHAATETTYASEAEPEGAAEAEEDADEALSGGAPALAGWWYNHDPEAQADAEVEEGSPAAEGTAPVEDPTMVVVPAPAEGGEEYQAYGGRLEQVGLVPDYRVLSDVGASPDVGPEQVVTTNPGPGSQVDPGATVTVRYNPDTAPEPAEGGGWTAPAVPALDLSPLTGIGVGCDKFPFGIFCWVLDGLGGWSQGSGQCPYVAVPFGDYGSLEYDFCDFEPAMQIIRPFIVLVSAFGVAWLLSSAALGIGGGGSEAE